MSTATARKLWDFVLPEGIEFVEKTTKPLGKVIGGEGIYVSRGHPGLVLSFRSSALLR